MFWLSSWSSACCTSWRERQPRTSMDSATRLSWLSPALENARMLGIKAAGILSMQKNPMSSSAFMATDLPAPDIPLTIRSSI